MGIEREPAKILQGFLPGNQHLADAMLTALRAEGWQVVPALTGGKVWPVEMNHMADEFFKAHDKATKQHGFYESFYAAWNAALRVAPKTHSL